MRSAAFHKDKGLKTWRKQRDENVNPTLEPFEKLVESTPLPSISGELVRSQRAKVETVV